MTATQSDFRVKQQNTKPLYGHLEFVSTSSEKDVGGIFALNSERYVCLLAEMSKPPSRTFGLSTDTSPPQTTPLRLLERRGSTHDLDRNRYGFKYNGGLSQELNLYKAAFVVNEIR